MISWVSLLTTPMKPGETRDVAVWGDEPHTVAIKCFVNTPPPPGFKECSTCGSYSLNSGIALKIVASDTLFRGPVGRIAGNLSIQITDNTGDQKTFTIEIIP